MHTEKAHGKSDAIEEPFFGSTKNLKKWFFKAPFVVPQRTFQNRVL